MRLFLCAFANSQFLKQVALSVLSDYQRVITTNTGAVQLWSISPTEHPSPDLIWNREEALSAITVSEFVELPEQTSVVSVKLQNEGTISRSAGHYQLYIYHSVYLTWSILEPPSLPLQLCTSVCNTVVPINHHHNRQLYWPHAESIRIPTTHHRNYRIGHVYAIDTANGEIVWSRILGSDGPANRVKRSKDGRNLLQDLDDIQCVMVDGFLLRNETRAVMMLDEFLQVSVYMPASSSTR